MNTPLTEPAKRGIGAISLPGWVMLGALAGVVAGVVFGERAAILEPVGSAYAMMLQISVYPYLLSALLYGLGRLTPAMARRLLRASWGVYLFMWCLTFAGIWLLALAIPAPPLPSVLTPDTVRAEADILELLIPANLFDALGRNYVPAVVVFAIIYGIAIQKVERKSALFEVLEAVQVASVTIWGWIVRFAPIGVFALFASAAGTIEPARLSGLLLYVGLLLIGTLLLAFVVLPAALAALVPVGHREILKELQPAMTVAAVTTLSVVALPFVQRTAERVATKAGCPEGEERADVIKAVLSLSYVLAQLGNYFVYLLMLYAAYAYKVQLTPIEQLLLPVWTLLSGLGSPSAVVDGVIFLGNWLRLPSDLLNLFLETWTVTRYGQVLLSVMGFAFATILIPLVYFGRVRLRPSRGLSAAAVTVVLFGVVIAGGTVLRPLLLRPTANILPELTLDPALTSKLPCAGRRRDRNHGRQRSDARCDPKRRGATRRLQFPRHPVQLLERERGTGRVRHRVRLPIGPRSRRQAGAHPVRMAAAVARSHRATLPCGDGRHLRNRRSAANPHGFTLLLSEPGRPDRAFRARA